jgi:hypothetical protein
MAETDSPKVRRGRPSGIPREGRYGKGIKTKVVRVPETVADNIVEILETFERIKTFVDDWDKTIVEAAEHSNELKTLAPYFYAVRDGSKTFELRKNDRGFKVGDNIKLVEYDPVNDLYSGEEIRITVTYILENYGGIQPGWCILGFFMFDNGLSGKLRPD